MKHARAIQTETVSEEQKSMATFNLTAGKDFFPTDQGTAGNDLIIANAGDDVVFGGPGDDQIYGGAQVNNAAGSGNDVLIGDNGEDTIRGGDGDDVLDGGGSD